MDVRRQVPEAFLHAVEPGKRAEHGEVGRPDMGGDELRLRTGFQRQLQQVPAVQAQNGSAVRVDVPDGGQAGGQLVRRFERPQQDQVAALVNRADLSGDGKARLRAGRESGQAQLFAQYIQALLRGDKLFLELGAPGGVRKVARTQQRDPLAACPPVQVRRVAVPAGGPGKTGVYMQVGNVHVGALRYRYLFLL